MKFSRQQIKCLDTCFVVLIYTEGIMLILAFVNGVYKITHHTGPGSISIEATS